MHRCEDAFLDSWTLPAKFVTGKCNRPRDKATTRALEDVGQTLAQTGMRSAVRASGNRKVTSTRNGDAFVTRL
jgi:hypothetical protein